MKLHLTMQAREEWWSPLPPEVVAERLRDAVYGGVLTGSVLDGTFELQHRPGRTRNSWRPFLLGELVDHEGGTLLRIRLRPHVLVIVFTLVHAIPFLGLSWLLGVAAFSWEVPAALAALGEAAQATPRTATEPRISADTAPAPQVVLLPTIRPGGATLSIGGRTVELGAQGVLWEDAELVAIAWDDVGRVRVEGDVLVVLDDAGNERGRLAAPGAPPYHLDIASALLGGSAHHARAAARDGLDPGAAIQAVLQRMVDANGVAPGAGP